MSDGSAKSSPRSIASRPAPPAHRTATILEASGATGIDSTPRCATRARNSPSSGWEADFNTCGSETPTYCANCRELSGSLIHRTSQPTMSTLASCSSATFGWKKVVGDEAAQRDADSILIVGHDSGMRDGQSERTAEQSHDREPIGASADHAGLGESAQVSQRRPVHLGEAGGDENDGHQQEQREGDRPHAP